MRTATGIAGVLLVCVVGVVFGQVKYGVKAEFDKKTDFSKLKTYSWSTRYSALDKEVHAQIVAAIDRHLAEVGLQKQASGPSDVTVVYDSQLRTDVDTKKKAAADGTSPTYPVGTLNVRLLDRAGKVLFRGYLLKPISVERDKLAGEIEEAVSEIFAKYPGRSATAS